MLFHSSIRKELARSFGATLVILLTIVVTMMLIRTLGLASRGGVDPSEVMLVLGYTVLGHLPTILTLSLFVAIVSTLSRMYADSEMVIWLSSGRGLASFWGPLLRFSWPVLVVIAVMALVVWPWSNQQSQDLRGRYEKRGDLDRVAPGQFQESASGKRVFFVDKDTPDNRFGHNVFIASTERGKETVTSARTGSIGLIDDERYLLLSRGQRLESTPGQPDIKISEFEEYGNQIGSQATYSAETLPSKSLGTLTLLRNPSRFNQGELAWRLGLSLAAFNFVLIGLAVASANPRAGRSGHMMFALFAFILYYNLINLGQGWIGAGKAEFAPLMLGLHGGAFALGLFWLYKRHYNWSVRLLLRRLRPPGPQAAGRAEP